MLFRMLYDDKLAQAAYLIGCQRTGEALIVDPEHTECDPQAGLRYSRPESEVGPDSMPVPLSAHHSPLLKQPL